MAEEKKPQNRSYSKHPTSKEVDDFHRNSDKDGGPKAIHHTLGPSPRQASPGDHSHDGGSSAKIVPLDGVTLSGSRTGMPTAFTSIIAALKVLGAADNTTP